MKVLLIGEKGAGKSSLLYSLFKDGAGGIICLPVFKDGGEIGKDAINLLNGERKRFCRIKERADFDGIEIGKYVVDYDGIEFCIAALEEALEKSNFIILDEFGLLEMKGGGLYEITKKIIEGDKDALIVLRKELEKEFLEKFPYQFKKIYLE